jgi:hypothetical protein
MRIEFEQTEDDIAAAATTVIRFNSGTAAGRRTQRIAALMTGTLGVAFGVLFLRYDAELGRTVVGGAAVGLVMFASQIWPTAGRAATNAKKYACRALAGPVGHCLLGPRTFEVTPEALRVTGPYAQSVVRWPAVGYIRRDEDYLFISVAGGSVFPIPRDAFDSDTAFDRYADAIEAAHRAAAGAGADEAGQPEDRWTERGSNTR